MHTPTHTNAQTHTCTNEHTHKQLFPTCWGSLENHFLSVGQTHFIHLLFTQTGKQRTFTAHTCFLCVCVSVRTCGCGYIKKFKRDRERNLFFHVWIKTKCTFRRVHLCTCKLQETFYDVCVSVYICVWTCAWVPELMIGLILFVKSF